MESAQRHALVLATDTASILVTVDSGRTWEQVPTDPQYLSMISMTWLPSGEAWALDARGAIWAGDDRGLTWSLLATGSG
jgi:photosystem II stability/assembly factor-like uncharacterized protein